MARLNDFKIQKDSQAVITGKVSFSTLKEPKQQTQPFAETKPSYKLTIDVNDENSVKGRNEGDAELVKYLQASIFTHKNSNQTAISVKRTGQSTKLDPQTHRPFQLDGPSIFDTVHSGSQPSNKVLKGELAQGQDVRVIVKANENTVAGGVYVSMVAIQVKDIDSVEYFGGNGGNQFDIAGFGLTQGDGAPMSANANPAAEAPVADNSFAQPAQQSAPAPSQPTQDENPFGTATSQPAQPNNQNNANNPFDNPVDGNTESPF